MKSENWDCYYNILDPNKLWELLYNTIKKYLDIMCPIKFIRVQKNSPPWITHDILEAINDRNMLFKTACTNKTEENLRNARLQRNRVSRLINSSKETYIKETLENNRDKREILACVE